MCLYVVLTLCTVQIETVFCAVVCVPYLWGALIYPNSNAQQRKGHFIHHIRTNKLDGVQTLDSSRERCWASLDAPVGAPIKPSLCKHCDHSGRYSALPNSRRFVSTLCRSVSNKIFSLTLCMSLKLDIFCLAISLCVCMCVFAMVTLWCVRPIPLELYLHREAQSRECMWRICAPMPARTTVWGHFCGRL